MNKEENELFRMEHITKTFPGVKALSDVSFSVNKGEVHGLVGENGAGKSTLMKVMSGVYQPDSGEIFIEGVKVKMTNIKKAQEQGVAIIFQELNLLPHLTVADNIFIGRQPTMKGFIHDKKMHSDTQIILDELGINLNSYEIVSRLSVAQQQMVEIAKAISMDSKILVLDEPSAALTEKEIEQLFKIIRKLQEKNVGMVYISHRMEELAQICARVTVLRDGAYIGTERYADITTEKLVNMIVGRELHNVYPKHQRKIGDTVLEINHLENENGINVAGISVRSGEIVGIAGLMGAGRTEIARCLFGADKALKLDVRMDGKPVKITKVSDAIKYGIGYATEDRKYDGLALQLDVRFNVNMASLSRITRKGIVDDQAGEETARKYKEKLSIRTPSLGQTVANLSGGNQQKIVLAKWLCNDVNVLIVDEPTRGIDVGAKYEVYELFNELSDLGVAIIMISSDLPEVLGMSDRIFVIHEGTVNGELPAKDTTQEEILYLAAGYNKNMENIS